MTLSNKQYDILKWICLLVLPASAALVLTVFQTWGISYAEPIAATITAVDAFLGAVTGISSHSYAKDQETGILNVSADGVYASLPDDPSELVGQTLTMTVRSVD